jgi:hypothetical protein
MSSAVSAPCAQFPAPTTDPMTYLPFSGHYQQLGEEAYIPPSTGATGATGAAGAGKGDGGTHSPAAGDQPHGGAQAPTSNKPTAPVTTTTPPANTTPVTTTPATPPPTTTTPAGGAQAPTTGAT